MLAKNQKNPKRDLEAIKKLVIFHQILKLLEPDFRSQFSGWRGRDMRNLIGNDLKDPSFDFLKIQSDFDLLYWFRRYSRLKSGPEGPDTYPAPDSGPNISRTRFFPNMGFSPWVREGLDLSSFKKSIHISRLDFRRNSKNLDFHHFLALFSNFAFLYSFILKIGTEKRVRAVLEFGEKLRVFLLLPNPFLDFFDFLQAFRR